jgi:hypothetical protein
VTSFYGGAAAGNLYTALMFVNSSGYTCALHGYPGVAGLNAQGQQSGQAQWDLLTDPNPNDAPFTSPPIVSLAPGQVASASVHGSDGPTTRENCPSYVSFLVTPPNETQSVTVGSTTGLDGNYIHSGFAGCGFSVGPVVPGSLGVVS